MIQNKTKEKRWNHLELFVKSNFFLVKKFQITKFLFFLPNTRAVVGANKRVPLHAIHSFSEEFQYFLFFFFFHIDWNLIIMLFVSSKIVSDEAPHSPKSFVRVLPKNNNNIINRVSCSCHHNNIWKFTHHFVPRSAYFGLVCYIVICVFVLSLFLSLLFGYITHTHTDRHTQPYKIIIKILFFSFLFFFLVIFCCDLVLRHRVKKEFFEKKKKKCFVSFVCDRLVVCRCKKKKKKKK